MASLSLIIRLSKYRFAVTSLIWGCLRLIMAKRRVWSFFILSASTFWVDCLGSFVLMYTHCPLWGKKKSLNMCWEQPQTCGLYCFSGSALVLFICRIFLGCSFSYYSRMKIISWNVQGLKGVQVLQEITFLLRIHKPNMLFLIETLVNESNLL